MSFILSILVVGLASALLGFALDPRRAQANRT